MLVQSLVIAAGLGKKVLTVSPTFPVYAMQARLLDAFLIEVQVSESAKALAKKLEYLETLCARARELHDRGHGIKAITSELLGREELMSLVTGFDFSKRNLIRACLRVTDPPSVE